MSPKGWPVNKLGRLLDWFLPGLIGLCPIGTFAYHDAGIEHDAGIKAEAPPYESKSAGRRVMVSDTLQGRPASLSPAGE